MRTRCSLLAILFVATPLAVRAQAAAAPARLDRQQIQSMLIEDGFSSVATLRLADRSWVGVGAHDGTVVAFTVDAGTGRLLTEEKVR